VDTLGLLLGVAVTSASSTERAGAQVVLGRVLTHIVGALTGLTH
jgi:hypothetical protein